MTTRMTTSRTAPTTTRRTTSVLAGLALTTSLALTGCGGSSGSGDDGGDEGAGDVDAEQYYDDYRDAPVEDYAQPAPGAAPAERGVDQQPSDLPDPDEDNTFADAGVSGFVSTEQDPLSTFALDVDTGSMGVARALLGDGYAVPAASVRPEEWVNALPYDDPAPSDADLGVVAESALAPTLDDGTEVVRVGVSAREVEPDDRPRVNVTLVVDRSGSMDVRNRLGLVQSSLALLAERLEADDTVSVVSFDDQAAPILEPTPVRDTDAILDAVERLTPGGGTNLEGGLRLGYEQARSAYDPDAVNLVVLCSDGVANVGATGPGSITDTIAEEGADGIHLVTVGFGMGNYNDHLMEQLADLGDGFYSYVDGYDEAEQLFGTDLTTTLVPVATEARAQVAFDPEVVTSYRLIGYENRDLADEDFTDLGVDAGELGAGHHATALYEVTLAAGVDPGDTIGSAAVLWKPTGPGAGEAPPRDARVDLVAADPAAEPSSSMALATAAADLAQLLKGGPAYDERGVDLDDLDERIDALGDVAGARELADLVDLARRVR
jgi:Ca-activated chloride channel family protein